MQQYSDELLRALKDHLVQHFDTGGQVAALPGPPQVGAMTPVGAAPTATQTAGGILGIPGALTAQNQYAAQLAPTQQTNYQPAIAGGANQALQGYGQFNTNLAAQQQLAAQLQQQAMGGGPNPAQAALAQNTAANVEQQAALQAGQRGAGANVGLMARQIGQQGAGIQQNAVGQAATLQAQQQLAAESELQRQQQAMQAGITGEQQANTQLFGAGAGAQNAQNTGNIQNYGMAQYINSAASQANANATNATQAGALNALGAAGAAAYNAGVSNQGAGGYQPIYEGSPTDNGGAAGNSGNGGAVAGGSIGIMGGSPGSTMAKGGIIGKPITANKKLDKVAPKDRMPLPSHIKGMADIFHPPAMACGGSVMKSGGQIPGKAKVKGDSFKNDTVPIMASPGEVVIPKHVMESDDPGEAAKQFVNSLHSKYSKGSEEGDFKEALSRAIKTRKSK